MVQQVFLTPFSQDIQFTMHPEYLRLPDDNSVMTPAADNNTLSRAIAALESRFTRHMADRLQLQLTSMSHAEASATRLAVANMLGSISFFFGSSVVQEADGFRETPPGHLVSGVPSRSFFPRGFMWDEGFHYDLFARWDPMMAAGMLQTWFNLADSQGWIAREQILGGEARSRIPQKFMVCGLCREHEGKFRHGPGIVEVLRVGCRL